MNGDSENDRYREVTKVLADLDLLFSVGKDAEGRFLWNLTPIGQSASDAVPISMFFREDFFHVFHLSSIGETPGNEKLLGLLELNCRLPIAKVGLEAESDRSKLLWAGVQILPSAINAEIVKAAIGAIVTAARSARKILEAESGATRVRIPPK